jgi:hypothetical protein
MADCFVGCSGGFLPAILHGVQFRHLAGQDLPTFVDCHPRGIAPAKELTDAEHRRGPFEGVRICAYYRQFAAVRTVVVDRDGAIGAYSCGKAWRPTRARERPV